MSYETWVGVHVLSFLGFLVTHPVPAALMFRIRRAPEPDRVRHLLKHSFIWNLVSNLFLVATIVAGVVLATMGHWWNQGWPWAALFLVVGLYAAMAMLATRPYGQLRKAFKSGSATPETLAALTAKLRPGVAASVGLGFLAAILALMFAKPF